jgi:hypothetical protein
LRRRPRSAKTGYSRHDIRRFPEDAPSVLPAFLLAATIGVAACATAGTRAAPNKEGVPLRSFDIRLGTTFRGTGYLIANRDGMRLFATSEEERKLSDGTPAICVR